MLALLLCAAAQAASDPLPDMTIPKPGGGTVLLTGVTLVKVEPDGLKVMHSAGAAKVPIECVPANLHAIYGLTTEKAKAHREAAQAASPTIVAVGTPEAPTAKKPELTTPAAIKAFYLSQCDARMVNPLDRDAGRRKAVLAKKADRINRGRLDPVFELQAHEHNEKAYRAAGDDAKADEAHEAAVKISEAAMAAARMEATQVDRDVIVAKGTSQAPGNR